MEGWIKIHRKMLENPIICKDSDYLSVWIYLLLNATHKEIPALFKGEKITLKPGQLITGRKSISKQLNISESKIYRVINEYKNEHQIEQQTSNKNSLITIANWNLYQQSEQQNEQQMNNNWTTTEHKQECNNNYIYLLNKYRLSDRKDFSEYMTKVRQLKEDDKYILLNADEQLRIINEL